MRKRFLDVATWNQYFSTCLAKLSQKVKLVTKLLIALMPVSDRSSQANGNLETRLNSSKGGGSPLTNDVRSFMEPRFGADFSSVQVHTGSEAVQMNAV